MGLGHMSRWSEVDRASWACDGSGSAIERPPPDRMPRRRRQWYLAGCIARYIRLPSELEERLGDKLEGLALDLAVDVTAAAQADLRRNLRDGDALAGKLEIRRHLAHAPVCDAIQFEQRGVIRAVKEGAHGSRGGVDTAGKVAARERENAWQVTQRAGAERGIVGVQRFAHTPDPLVAPDGPTRR